MEQLRDVFHQIFLSTLSLRRATETASAFLLTACHFYPRSPCGERLAVVLDDGAYMPISIHALLAESDAWCCLNAY